MSFFDVPGWSVPKDVQPASTASSRKRKRPGTEGAHGEQKRQNAEVNLEKLMKKLGNESGSLTNNKDQRRKKNKHGDKDHGDANSVSSRGGARPCLPSKSLAKQSTPLTSKAKGRADDARSGSPSPTRVAEIPTEKNSILGDERGLRNPSKKVKRKRKDAGSASAGSGAQVESQHNQHGEPSNAHLTALQSKMKQSLDGARFRWINEMLYKSSSQDTERLMREDPKVFDEYHAGFRHQVISWPANPVDHFIRTLAPYPAHSVIVDLGCGDATLARNLLPKGHIVLSYDLVSANPYIVAADICDRIPLPGAEDSDTGQIVDVVVCSLSLMSTNWLNCLREARRVLKTGGELKIAEVASRFTNVDRFTSVVSSIGFRLIRKDDENTHFTLFDFKKTDGARSLDEKSWKNILSRGDVLQPCEYKRR